MPVAMGEGEVPKHDGRPSQDYVGNSQDVHQDDRSDHSDTSSNHDQHHNNLERTLTAKDETTTSEAKQTLTTVSSAGPLHSVFTKNQKHFIVFMASWGGFFSAVSSNIYFPALNSLASDLHVSNTLINLTLTSYMIFQGLAPAFIGELADTAGRRPAYFFCFVVYIAACIGLALQNSYAALFLLRCLQSTGSSGTIALSSGVVADVATAQERGKYMGFVSAGALLGPAIGPVVGGILSQLLGWRSLFWFLVIFASCWLSIFIIFFPETARTAVGNGSIPPKGWNMSLLNYLAARKARKEHEADPSYTESIEPSTPKKKRRFPNPLSSIPIIYDKENAIILLMNAFLFATFYDITATLPSTYAVIYGFNDLQIGLCYIPFGVGACCAALSNGQLLDRNFRRWARNLNFELKKGRQTDLTNFPIEKARLQVAFPGYYVASLLTVAYAWNIEYNGPLAVCLVLLFFMAYSLTVSFNVSSTLLIDFYPHSPATATAANNLFRCLLGAGATGVIQPMIDGMGRGWAFTFLALFLLASSPLLWVVYFRGMKWRGERTAREKGKREKKEKRDVEKAEEKQNSKNRKSAGTSLPVEGGSVEMVAVAGEEDWERGELHRKYSRSSGLE
jgi:MFS family permease